MFHVPNNIADNENGGGLMPLLIIGFWVVIAIIGGLSKALAKSRQQRQTPRGLGPKPTATKPAAVDDFLEAIRRIAKSEAGPEQPPEPKPQQPTLMRPAPPPPPRPLRPSMPARPTAAPPPRPAPLRAPTPPRIERPPIAPRAPERPPEPVMPKVTPEPISALRPAPPSPTPPRPMVRKGAPSRPPRGGPPKREPRLARQRARLTEEAKPRKKAAPAPVRRARGTSPADLRAALRQRLAAGPSAMREAIVLGEVLGQPISMRRRRAHRPGGPSRLM